MRLWPDALGGYAAYDARIISFEDAGDGVGAGDVDDGDQKSSKPDAAIMGACISRWASALGDPRPENWP